MSPAAAGVPPPPQIPGYQYVADIAIGGYSVVYRYRQRSPRRDVAIKVLTAFGGDVAPEQRDAEANVMAKLGNHPNIVQVIVADVTPDGRHYIVMPYYPGRSLAELVAEGPFAIGPVLRVGVQVAAALDAAHRLGLLHRDIKPANILIDEYGTPRLTDFGIAGWVGPDQQLDPGGLSLPWSPAEVIAGGDSRKSSDIYSLGALLFHLLVGQPPHAQPADTRSALEWRIQNSTAPPTGRSDVPDALEDLLARMLARAPERRPPSASMVAAELRDIEAALGGPAPADAPWHASAALAATVPRFAPAPARVLPPGTSGGTGAPVTEKTTIRERSRLWAPVSEQTELRPNAARDEGPADAGRTRISVWVWAVAAAVVVALVTAGLVFSSSGSGHAPTTVTGAASQNAGANADLPPGIPAVTSVRIAQGLQFDWTYDGAEATDTFVWRVSGSDHTAVVHMPTVVVPDKPGTQLCIQVKVVRLSGNGNTDWSPEGCGS